MDFLTLSVKINPIRRIPCTFAAPAPRFPAFASFVRRPADDASSHQMQVAPGTHSWPLHSRNSSRIISKQTIPRKGTAPDGHPVLPVRCLAQHRGTSTLGTRTRQSHKPRGRLRYAVICRKDSLHALPSRPSAIFGTHKIARRSGKRGPQEGIMPSPRPTQNFRMQRGPLPYIPLQGRPRMRQENLVTATKIAPPLKIPPAAIPHHLSITPYPRSKTTA